MFTIKRIIFCCVIVFLTMEVTQAINGKDSKVIVQENKSKLPVVGDNTGHPGEQSKIVSASGSSGHPDDIATTMLSITSVKPNKDQEKKEQHSGSSKEHPNHKGGHHKGHHEHQETDYEKEAKSKEKPVEKSVDKSATDKPADKSTNDKATADKTAGDKPISGSAPKASISFKGVAPGTANDAKKSSASIPPVTETSDTKESASVDPKTGLKTTVPGGPDDEGVVEEPEDPVPMYMPKRVINPSEMPVNDQLGTMSVSSTRKPILEESQEDQYPIGQQGSQIGSGLYNEPAYHSNHSPQYDDIYNTKSHTDQIDDSAGAFGTETKYHPHYSSRYSSQLRQYDPTSTQRDLYKDSSLYQTKNIPLYDSKDSFLEESKDSSSFHPQDQATDISRDNSKDKPHHHHSNTQGSAFAETDPIPQTDPFGDNTNTDPFADVSSTHKKHHSLTHQDEELYDQPPVKRSKKTPSMMAEGIIMEQDMGLNNDMEVKKENLVKEDSDATKKGKADDKGKIVADAKTYSIVKTTDGKSAPAQVVPAAGAASVTPTSVTTTAAKTATTTATPTTTSTTTTPPATTTTTAAKTTETTPSSTSTVDTNKSH